ncbi:MAG: ATP-dependent DNA helicase [Patescibacteria group bacterium]|jgi:DNA helicase-2/ATP-dependent DNA helicase PcrA
MPNELLEGLNPEQLAAVTHGTGPLMIIAGAGTGKTTVITQRIAWLIEQGKAKPDQILALTFTEKAATEMEERVDMLLPLGYVDLWISTFHAFCERILREHALDIGLPPEFTLVDEIDALLLARKNFSRFSLDYYRPRGNPTRYLKAILSHISRAKDEMITPDRYLRFAEEEKLNLDSAEGLSSTDREAGAIEVARHLELANAYHLYQQILLENHALDFADLVSYTIELLKKRPQILKKYQEQFKVILVDEFQDTNTAQYELVKMLAATSGNLTVVGDDDQSIYRFRGASLANIMQFRTDYPAAARIVLMRNYRSGKPILSAAYTLIQKNNPDRLEIQEKIGKELLAHVEGGEVERFHCGDEKDEIEAVIKKILTLHEGGAHWGDVAILVRANHQAEPFVAACEAFQIPYRFLAMSGLYAKPLIIDCLAWMHVLDQRHDSPSFYRLLHHEQLGVPAADLSTITLYCQRKALSIFDALKFASAIPGLSPEGLERVQEILTTLSSLEQKARNLPVSELFLHLVKDAGLEGEILKLKDEAEKIEMYGFLNQFYKRLQKFILSSDDPSLHQFLVDFSHEREAGEEGGLATDVEAGPDVVQIMTIHASKGLEFPYVFLVNMVEQRFPSQNRGEAIPMPEALMGNLHGSLDAHIAEERRLCYVAMTRAKKGLFLFSADDYGGSRKRKPSRFLDEAGLAPNRFERVKTFGAEEASPSSENFTYRLPKTVSFTQIAAFTTCPLQYKFAHILKIPVFGRHQLSFGKSMHNTLHQFFQTYLASQETAQPSLFGEPKIKIELPEKKELLSMLESCWIDEWYPDSKTRDEYFEKAKSSLVEYHGQLLAGIPKIFALEKGFTLHIGDVILKGRIDRIDSIDGGVEIIDYKTGKPKEKLEKDDKRQLILYAIAAEQSFDPPLHVVKATFHYLENNQRTSFVPTEKEKQEFKDMILETVGKIRVSLFVANPGEACKYCDFKDICEFRQS